MMEGPESALSDLGHHCPHMLRCGTFSVGAVHIASFKCLISNWEKISYAKCK